jgi:hypothetical protein
MDYQVVSLAERPELLQPALELVTHLLAVLEAVDGRFGLRRPTLTAAAVS